MTAYLQIDGAQYTGFKEFTITKDLENLSGSFSFTATTKRLGNFPIRRGAKCVVIINNTPLITGYVDNIEISHDAGSHDISLQGRDKTCDIIDSTIHNIELQTPISLESVIQAVLNYLDITDIKIINTVSGLKPYSKNELVSAEVGQGCFDFLDSFCRKRQVMLTADGSGNVIITRGEGTRINAALVSRIGGTSNNIIGASVKYDDSKRFRTYQVISQVNPVPVYNNDVTEEGNETPAPDNSTLASFVGTEGFSSDAQVRVSRKIVLKAENASGVTEVAERAKWERDVRCARALSYSCKVQGFTYSPTGSVWQPLQIVSVYDDLCNVKNNLLIRSVRHSLSLNGGEISELELVPVDAYLLEAQEKQKQAKKQKGKGGGTGPAELNFVMPPEKTS